MTRRRRWWRLGGDDRGAVTVELVIAVPVVMFMILAVVQFAVWLHAVHVADTAAVHALAAARVDGGTTQAGQQQARHALAELGDSVLDVDRITVHRGTTSAEVHITGTARTVVPGLHLPVRAVAYGPVERFVVGSGGGR